MDDSKDATITATDSPTGAGGSFRDRRFVPTAELGRGGMGIVFRCHDANLGRDVAVKVQRAPSPESTTRFTGEARLQARLQHPAIVPVYDLERAADGTELIVMREVAGRNLRTTLCERSAGRHALLSVFSRICRAVDYCHTSGVLHRDLKPENIMLGDFGEVYIVDWGLAVERDAPRQRRGGTPGYVAPEQLTGHSTEASDVFSLGAILLEILGEQGPDHDGPPELVALARQATSIDPAARPTSARALAEAVDRFLDGERDLALRQKLADDAARDANLAVTRGARRDALREAGRALALDPDHAGARSVLRDLLTRPPTELPPEVAGAKSRQMEVAIRSAATAGAIGFATTLALMSIEVAMGVRDITWFVARAVLAVLAVLACAGLGRWWRASATGVAIAFLLSIVMIASTSLVLGPFILVPSLAVVLSAALGALAGRRWVAATAIAATLVIAVPLLLELTGVIAPSMTFTGGSLVISPRLLDLPPQLTVAYLLVKEVLVIVVVGMMMSRYHGVIARAERAIAVHAWQLEQLVPAKP